VGVARISFTAPTSGVGVELLTGDTPETGDGSSLPVRPCVPYNQPVQFTLVDWRLGQNLVVAAKSLAVLKMKKDLHSSSGAIANGCASLLTHCGRGEAKSGSTSNSCCRVKDRTGIENALAQAIPSPSCSRPKALIDLDALRIGAAIGMGKWMVAILEKDMRRRACPFPLRVRYALTKKSPDETAKKLLRKRRPERPAA